MPMWQNCSFPLVSVNDGSGWFLAITTSRLTAPVDWQSSLVVDGSDVAVGVSNSKQWLSTGMGNGWTSWLHRFSWMDGIRISAQVQQQGRVQMAQRYFLMLPRRRCNVGTTIRNGEGGQLLITSGWLCGDGSITKLGNERGDERAMKRPEVWRHLAQFWYPK